MLISMNMVFVINVIRFSVNALHMHLRVLSVVLSCFSFMVFFLLHFSCFIGSYVCCLTFSRISVMSVQCIYDFNLSLRKLAHAIYRDFFSPVKIENFIRKKLIIFLFLLKT